MFKNFSKRKVTGYFSRCVIGLLILMVVTNRANSQDSLAAFHEFAKLRQIYGHVPVQVEIDIRISATPFTNPQDTLGSTISFYVGLKGMYLEAEGLEEIVNDSLVIVVNNPARQITIFPNSPEAMQKMRQSSSMFLPDSSVGILAEKYTSSAQDIDGNKSKITFQSRETLHGSKQSKEIISATFQKSSYQPVEIEQVKMKPVLIDSVFYARFVSDKMYDGKLNKAVTGKGNLFFLTKELKTTYRFRKIDYAVPNPPARQQDRVNVDENGNYTPAKGYEEYLLSKEF